LADEAQNRLTFARGTLTLAHMQTLGLSSEATRSDGRLKSLLWPTVENAWDVDYLGQQGMWICTAVAVFTLLGTVFSGNVVVIATGLFFALFYVLGGMGVRQANWPAAAFVFIVYLLGAMANLSFAPVNIIRLVCALVLLSNVRAAFLAAEWKPAAEGEDRPTRFNQSLADKYIDQIPAKLWPRLQIPFIILAILVLLLELLGLGILLVQRFGLMPHA
jgi:hypothetical protein